MRGYRWFAIGVIVCGCGQFSGCQSAPAPRTVITAQPGLTGPGGSDNLVADGNNQQVAPVKTAGFVDRHPLFSKPRDFWDTSGDNKVVKAAAATFVGIPVGMYGEVKQIIVGTPPEPRF
jgi:hypothetical protein